ncbi:MAG TPA: hypothetical protein VHM90_02680 [Phycisphaerae bacterium]|nr:hypothetical protein [Phycisphaerae bacterium]
MVDAPFESANGGVAALTPATDMYGMMRIVQSLPHERAESARRWLAAAGVARLEETADPELAIARAREEFQRRGYPQQWIDQRMRAMSARAQIVGEWHKRGAAEGSHYRELTNALFHAAFGMEVEEYRRAKGLTGHENLRDHMSEVELALVTLGETVGAELHRLQGSHTLHELIRDIHDAGVIVAGARRRIEEASGKQVVERTRKPWTQRGHHGRKSESAA